MRSISRRVSSILLVGFAIAGCVIFAILEWHYDRRASSSALELPSLDGALSDMEARILNTIVPRVTRDQLPPEVKSILDERQNDISSTWPDRVAGIKDAHGDLNNGKYMFKGWQPLSGAQMEYASSLSGKYGILFEPSMTVVTNKHRLAYVYGYNAAVRQYFVHRAGREQFDEMFHECMERNAEGFYIRSDAFFLPSYFVSSSEM